MRILLIGAVLTVLALVVATAGVRARDDHVGGRGPEAGVHQEHEDADHGNRQQLSSDEADVVADQLEDCLTDDSVQDLGRGQIKRLARLAGLNRSDLIDLLSGDHDGDNSGDNSENHHEAAGPPRHEKLTDQQAHRLARDLRDRLGADDLQELTLGQIFQIAGACGIGHRELAKLLAEA